MSRIIFTRWEGRKEVRKDIVIVEGRLYREVHIVHSSRERVGLVIRERERETEQNERMQRGGH